MVSFYKRGDYQWEAKIRKAGFPQLAKTFESKADAVAWAAEVETGMRRGTFVSRAEAERKTLGALIGQYIQEVSPLHRGADSEIARLKAMARRKIAETAMANLRPIDIARYRDERLKVDGVCPATVVCEMGLLQRVIAHAMQEWEIALLSFRSAPTTWWPSSVACQTTHMRVAQKRGRLFGRQGLRQTVHITHNSDEWRRAMNRSHKVYLVVFSTEIC